MDRGSLIIIFALAALAIGIAGLVSTDEFPRTTAIVSSDGSSGNRVVSLAPCITGTLLAIGAEQSISLISDYCPQIDGVGRGGTALSPDLERIVRSGSRILLVRSAVGLPRDELARVGETIELPWSSVEQVAGSIRRIGSVVERESSANQLADRFEQVLAGSGVAEDAPRVLLVIGTELDASGGPWVIKPNSIHGAVLRAAGFRNAIEKPMSGTPQISFERLLAIDPDIILHLSSAPEEERSQSVLDRYRHLAGLGAVTGGAVGQVLGPRILDEGPELLDLVGAIQLEVERLATGGARW
ncbi:MAG: ABC transporter substrate-binding protein [Planctomycetota bacterium]|nr:ABC transporter substrate-binding protein [Planctomycetota bacterium]